MKLTPLSHCLLCDNASPAALLCPPCAADLPRNLNACWQCALPLPQPGLCPDCQQHPPAFSRCLAAFVYQPPLSQMLNNWKHHADQRPFRLMAKTLQQLLLTHYQQDDWPQALVPVPLHRRRLMTRGFHQTRQIAHYLGRQLGIASAPDLLSKSAGGHSQQGLDRQHRLNNLKGSFHCGGDPAGRHLALVDDVMTTGATANLLAELLLKRGATRVDVWVLARTP